MKLQDLHLVEMDVQITSIPKTKDNALKTDGRIVVKRNGKTFAFDTEEEAKMHFGRRVWNKIKSA